MFSQLGQIWTQTLRRAEPTDTHEYIRKHQREDGKHKKGGDQTHKDESDIFDSADNAIVSVFALDAFLQSIIQNHRRADEKPSLSEAAHDIQTPKMQKKKPKESLRAPLNAYEHAAETIETNKSYEITEEQSETLNLSDGDIQDIKLLITDLQILKKNHILDIEISKGSSFLQSLRIAIKNALPKT